MSAKIPGYQHQNHRRPMTRRDLLAQGFLTAGGAVCVPSLLSLISQRAYGAADPVCQASAAASRMVPFLIFDLAGGGNIAGTNVLVGGAGGQGDTLPLGSYATIGLAPAAEPGKVTADTTFGLAFHPASKMLAGMKGAAPTVVATPNVDGALFCTSSSDDTTSNPHSPLYWIAKGGMTGSLVTLIGSKSGPSGGNSVAPQDSIDPGKQPSVIAAPADASGLVDSGTLGKLLTPAGSVAAAGAAAAAADVSKVLGAIKTMSDSRIALFQAQDVSTQIQDLMRCGYINASSYLSNFTPDKLDPTKDPLVTGVYKALATDKNQQAAGTIAKLVLDGYAGAGVVSLPGYDYHGQGRAAQDAKDLLAGQMIGMALELAAQKKQPLMIYVYTDGGVSATPNGDVNGIYAFSSDSGQRSAAFTLVYNPTAKPVMSSSGAGKGRQVGSYSASGAVNATANLISSNVENLSKAVAVNWLALHGLDNDPKTRPAALGGVDPFGADIAKYVAFGKLT